jgi:hypothetical protein
MMTLESRLIAPARFRSHFRLLLQRHRFVGNVTPFGATDLPAHP